MLKIYAKPSFRDDCIISIDSYFNRHKKRDWFNRQDVKDIIYGVDKTIAVKDEYMESPVFGGISPRDLSTGCKALILLAVLDNPHIYGTRLGDNCVEWLLKIGETRDIFITLHHYMIFPESGFEAYMMDTGVYIHSMEEFVYAFYTTYH